MGMKVFVAGRTGVLGRATVLMEAGQQVRVVARGAEKAERIRRMGAIPVEVDFYDREALRRGMAGCDAVLRLTTKIPPTKKMRGSAEGSVERRRSRRPSRGWALRSLGKETENWTELAGGGEGAVGEAARPRRKQRAVFSEKRKGWGMGAPFQCEAGVRIAMGQGIVTGEQGRVPVLGDEKPKFETRNSEQVRIGRRGRCIGRR
jgi:hypothetical protein